MKIKSARGKRDMSRMETFNYIEEKLNLLVLRIKARSQMNLLDLNIHTESFISNLLNVVYGWNLININIKKRNMEAIDLVDDVNKIIVQVSSVHSKRKIQNVLNSEIMLQFKNYSFKYVCLVTDAKKLWLKVYNNPHDIKFNPKEDIIDIAKILNTILYLSVEKQEQVKSLIDAEFNTLEASDKKTDFQLDLELKRAFENISDSSDESQSDLVKKMYERRALSFMKNVESGIDDGDNDIVQIKENVAENNYNEDTFLGNIMKGIHFTIKEQEGFATRFFEVYKYISCNSFKEIYTLDMLDRIEEICDGKLYLTFYLDDPQENGNRLVMISTNNEKGICIINTGLVIDKELHMPYNASILDINECKFKNTIDEKNVKEEYFDMGQENCILIYDSTITEPVLYEEYYNENKKEWRFRVKLKSDHHYCAFEALPVREHVTNEEIGECFLYGLYDFPQNAIKAIEFFEKANSAEGYFQIGKILMEDEELRDANESLQFIKKAAEMGSEEAVDYLAQTSHLFKRDV